MKAPIEVWQGIGRASGWTWYVLSKNRFKDEKPNDYARWFCRVTSPHTYGDGDLGDVYRREILGSAVRVND